MSWWASLDRRERGIVWASAYLGTLMFSSILMWWLILMGGSPFSVTNVGTFTADGSVRETFHAGEVAGIKRNICSQGDVGLIFHPALQDVRGLMFPLPISMIIGKSGCHTGTYGFIVPDLPPGEYSYVNTVRYQNNLVGRDEAISFPVLKIRIAK